MDFNRLKQMTDGSLRKISETYTDLSAFIKDIQTACAVNVDEAEKPAYKWTPTEIGMLYCAVVFSLRKGLLVSSLGPESTEQAIKKRQASCQIGIRYGVSLLVSEAESSKLPRDTVRGILEERLTDLDDQIAQTNTPHGVEGTLAKILKSGADRDATYRAIGEAVIAAAKDYSARKHEMHGSSAGLWNVALEYAKIHRAIQGTRP